MAIAIAYEIKRPHGINAHKNVLEAFAVFLAAVFSVAIFGLLFGNAIFLEPILRHANEAVIIQKDDFKG